MTTDTPPLRAAVADPKKLNDLLTRLFKPFFGDNEPKGGVQVHPAAFSLEPIGSKILVVCYPDPQKYGGIILPDEAKTGQAGMGVIMAAGWSAFSPGNHVVHPGTTYFNDAAEALYKVVMFGKYMGKPVVLNYVKDSNFSAEILAMTDRDPLALWDPFKVQPYEIPRNFLEQVKE